MRIAMVSEHASPLAGLGGVDAGGQNVHVAALAGAMARAGHDVRVFTRRDDPTLPVVVRTDAGYAVHHVAAGPPRPIPKDDLWSHMPVFATSLAEAWRDDPPDVVHSHFWMSGWAAQHAANGGSVPLVHTYHALGVTKRRHQGTQDSSPGARLAVERALAQDCDGIVATSDEEMFELVRMGAHPRRLALVPCGVDLERFGPDPRSGLGSGRGAQPDGPSEHRVLVVGRLVERKGIADVVRALPALPGARLLVAGGPDRAELPGDAEAVRLAGIARQEGVADRVSFLGRVAQCDLPALYRSADVVVCTPWYEPFGLVALEAMACGVPVVASAVGGLVDTVIDGCTGVHVPPRRPDLLGAALRDLLADEERRRELGRTGARRARARYGWPTVAEETLRFYARTRAVRTAHAVKVG
jgi:glycosyltransferase involved in cell wall biosynthesis